MKHGSLFSGIGGFDLAAERMGWNNAFHCEWNEFGQKVLKYYWPNAVSYGDITKTDFTIWKGQIDILTGGFPCQPYSQAGKRLGKEDDRHLWPAMLRAIREIQPTWIVGENVLGLVNWNGGLVFHEVQADLEAAGYEVQPFILPACAVNAPHRRDRIWFVAYCDNKRGSTGFREIQKENGEISEWNNNAEFGNTSNEFTSNTNSNERCERWMHEDRPDQAERLISECNTWPDWRYWQNFPTQPPVRSGDDGLQPRLDSITFSKWRNESIKAGGNAVVPQVVYQIFQAINKYHLDNP